MSVMNGIHPQMHLQNKSWSSFSQVIISNLASTPIILLWFSNLETVAFDFFTHAETFYTEMKIYNTTREKLFTVFYWTLSFAVLFHSHGTDTKTQYAINELSKTGQFTGRSISVCFFCSSGLWYKVNSTFLFTLLVWDKLLLHTWDRDSHFEDKFKITSQWNIFKFV
jgi:hypothetical protein